MICRNCNNPIDNDSLFCKHCGAMQKEKCPECGEMELIGHPVCETLLKKIRREKWKFISDHTEKFPSSDSGLATFLAFLIAVQVVIAIIAGIILILYFLGWVKDFIFPYALWATIFFGIESWLSYKAAMRYLEGNEKKMTEDRIKTEDKFLAENPEYAEILKKAEEKK
ncbi:MAG: Uncharacterized protein Athens071425_195 [Parcubacteria group bacterium Athens0714_25]|uniref:DZANK-type domain-containing protein n=1 Tax=Candidatus Berkelbacteria bacterium Athens1014_28 TaxID=2017145 RepID=A0A554LPV9_9BACT|nr:MAG: Uncharacterized protein Athens101428_112 [Candidatus Berkelbacteria bacterium Athens1014_28]TSD02041.1 MAG: Uncharacterized protein Athens071425_195 [Parcubacteria group bacterium Athens0714_25]